MLQTIYHFLKLEIQLMYNSVLVSAVHQSDSVIHTYILFQSRFHYRLLQGIEYGSLCCTGPYLM